ncbi:lipoprotein-anchoring transpeptidase ErfK/SrfK [Devosia sp. UYZn731]|uniref:L,D-transpeptidase family protein n=1 Tax=Devosia sp. UYZn731 TaxID=3156345 RepID=UPI00339B914C
MPSLTTRAAQAAFVAFLSIFAVSEALAQSMPISAAAINTASVTDYIVAAALAPAVVQVASTEALQRERVSADPALARLQILLDRAGASPGVIDGFDGDNLHKAVLAYQMMNSLPADGNLTLALAARLDAPGDAIGVYTITAEDAAVVGGPIPTDYAEKAAMDYLGYESVAELLAERFHMDIGLLAALNPSSAFEVGEIVNVAMTGTSRQGVVTWIEADKTLRQVRVYGVNGVLLAAYPATIGSEDNPSPTGTYAVERATKLPGYTYNPKINFQQGENADVLAIPPGPNGPVGSMWIALSKPSFGIHGTPEPSMIDKTGSHGCIRLTNWDAEELAAMVTPGVTVDFL